AGSAVSCSDPVPATRAGGGPEGAAAPLAAATLPATLDFGLSRAQGADGKAEAVAALGQLLSRRLGRPVRPYVAVSYEAGAGAFEESFTGSYEVACDRLVKGEIDATAVFLHGDTDGCQLRGGRGLRVLGKVGPIPGDGVVGSPELVRGVPDIARVLTDLHR